MAKKTNREQHLLLTLFETQGYMTAEELANILQISAKTIYRLIKRINDAEAKDPLIVSEKGRGYKLNYEKYLSQKKWQQNKEDIYSPSERRNRVMEELLLSSPRAKNIHNLFEDYYVGDSAIFNDEQEIARQIKEYELTLERKKRTLAIIGDERNIRRAIVDLVATFSTIDLDELESIKVSNLNNYDVLFVIRQLREIESSLAITIPYPYSVNIFSHLYILISRFRKVGALQIDKERPLTEKELAEFHSDPYLHQIAKDVIRNVENYLHQKLSELEVYYLYQYLLSSRMQGKSHGNAHNFSPKVMQITHMYLNEMTARLNNDMNNETNFLDLANHIKPMINRLENKIRIKNGLIEQIMITYPETFEQVTEVSEKISKNYDLPPIHRDENGFITLYFARILETNTSPIKTIIMCTTGIGTSELLLAKVEKRFPELEVIDVAASRYSKENLRKHPEAELILTTVQLPQDLPIQSLVVSAMLTADDQNRIQRKIEELQHGK